MSEQKPKIRRNERYVTEIASPVGLGQFDRNNPYDLTQLRIGKSNIISPTKSNSPIKLQHQSSVTSPISIPEGPFIKRKIKAKRR